jgi:hypothetical protein
VDSSVTATAAALTYEVTGGREGARCDIAVAPVRIAFAARRGGFPLSAVVANVANDRAEVRFYVLAPWPVVMPGNLEWMSPLDAPEVDLLDLPSGTRPQAPSAVAEEAFALYLERPKSRRGDDAWVKEQIDACVRRQVGPDPGTFVHLDSGMSGAPGTPWLWCAGREPVSLAATPLLRAHLGTGKWLTRSVVHLWRHLPAEDLVLEPLPPSAWRVRARLR